VDDELYRRVHEGVGEIETLLRFLG